MNTYKNNLSKENFWNGLKEKHPLAMAHFCKWIDEYKKEVNWDKLFNGEIATDDPDRLTFTEAPKFHDIPIEMQMGILDRYSQETHKEMGYSHIPDRETQTHERKIDITEMLENLEYHLTNYKTA